MTKPLWTGFSQLIETYTGQDERSLALFLGAGVNHGADGQHPRSSWLALARALHERNRRPRARSFDALQKKYAANWPRLLGEVTKGRSVDTVVSWIDEAIHQGMMRTQSLARGKQELPVTVLRRMPNLLATISFTAAVHRPDRNRSFRPNPRIGAVVTSNYDYFFGAGWTRYNSFPYHWRVRTFRSQRPLGEQRPIYYLHGFIPLRLRVGEIVRADCLVLDEKDYRREYDGRGRGFARRTLEEILSSFDVLFLGTSFSDEPLREALTKCNSKRRRFALVAHDDRSTLRNLEGIPVDILELNAYSEIPKALQLLYQSGLSTAETRRTGLPPARYWQKLTSGLEPRPRTRKL